MFKLLLAFVIHYMPLAEAGLRIINGGGGGAEMQAMQALADLPLRVSACLQYPHECDLNEGEVRHLEDWFKAGRFNTRMAEIEFMDLGGKIFAYDSNRPQYLAIDPRFIYAGDKPRPLAEIARLIFTGWMAPVNEPELVYSLGQKLFHSVHVSTQILEMGTESLLATTMGKPGRSANHVYISVVAKSSGLDLSADLGLCAGGEAGVLNKIISMNYENGHALLRAQWLCPPSSRRYTGLLAIVVNPGAEPLAKRIRVRKFQVRELNCSESLEDELLP